MNYETLLKGTVTLGPLKEDGSRDVEFRFPPDSPPVVRPITYRVTEFYGTGVPRWGVQDHIQQGSTDGWHLLGYHERKEGGLMFIWWRYA